MSRLTPHARAASYPTLRATGGPTPKDMRFTVDGREVPKAYRLELVMDARDAVRATFFQYTEAIVDVDAASIDEKYIVAVIRRFPVGEGDEAALAAETIGKAVAPSLSEALRVLAVELESWEPTDAAAESRVQ